MAPSAVRYTAPAGGARRRLVRMTFAEPYDSVVGVAVIDAEGRILVWSRSAEALFGYTAGDMSQRRVNALFQSWPAPSGEAVGCRKNGTTFPARVEIDSG